MSYKKSTTGGGLAAAPSHSAGGASGQHVPQSELRPQSNVVLRVGPGVAARRHFGQVFLFGREIGPLLYLRANHVSREQRGQALLGLGQRQRCGPGNCGSGPAAKGWVRRASWSGSGGIIRRSGDCADWTISPQGLFSDTPRGSADAARLVAVGPLPPALFLLTKADPGGSGPCFFPGLPVEAFGCVFEVAGHVRILRKYGHDSRKARTVRILETVFLRVRNAHNHSI